jgi:hypothetical protein
MDADERNRIFRSLRTVHRAVLTVIDINPKLARPKYRPELTLLANMLSGEHRDAEVGRALCDIHTLHQRGFLVRAYTDRRALPVDIDTARALIVEARRAFGFVRQDATEIVLVNAMLQMTGYTESDVRNSAQT